MNGNPVTLLPYPSGNFTHHENRHAQPAILFVLSNSPTLKALGYYREEGAPE